MIAERPRQRHQQTDERPPRAVADLPPSAKLVYVVLDAEGPLTQRELAAETRLPQRTVRNATRRLMDNGIVETRIYVPDARQSTYVLRRPPSERAGRSR